MSNFLTYKGAKDWVYALSITATWIWAPALFVSSEIGYKFGLFGLLVFTIPNALSLTWFGWVASKVRAKVDGVTLTDALYNASERQKLLHLIVSLVLLVCSTCTQLIGIDMVLRGFDAPKWLSALIVCAISLGLVYKNGIKGSIITDNFKYAIAAIGAGILAGVALTSSSGFVLSGHFENYSVSDFLFSFGLISTINYFSALFADQTFWQRAFSAEPKNIFSSFWKASLAFVPIPLLFGCVGMLAGDYGTNFNIATMFNSGFPSVVLILAASAILISTIDSNLCAVASYVETTKAKKYINPVIAMVALLAFGMTIMVGTSATVPMMFLIFGTIRTVVGIPTLLVVFNRFNEKRLFWATLFGMVVCAPMFVVCQATGFLPAWWFTVLALIIPIVGYEPKKISES